MTGWIAFLVLAAFVLLSLWRPGRLDRSALMLVSAALFVAAAGYVQQGHPYQAGDDALRSQNVQSDSSAFVTELRRLAPLGTGKKVPGESLEIFHRLKGAARAAALENRIERFPDDTALRVGYAYTLFEMAGYKRAPAVSIAFEQAARHAARCDPEVAYFEGFAELESGRMVTALNQWRQLTTRLCPHSPWARPLDRRIAALENALTEIPTEGRPL